MSPHASAPFLGPEGLLHYVASYLDKRPYTGSCSTRTATWAEDNARSGRARTGIGARSAVSRLGPCLGAVGIRCAEVRTDSARRDSRVERPQTESARSIHCRRVQRPR